MQPGLRLRLHFLQAAEMVERGSVSRSLAAVLQCRADILSANSDGILPSETWGKDAPSTVRLEA